MHSIPRKNIFSSPLLISFLLGAAIGGALGAALHKETLIIRPSVADSPAALTSVDLMIDEGNGTIKTWNTVSWHEAMSVLNLMETVAGAEGITILTKNISAKEATITAMNGLQNDTQTGMRWQYWINNTYEPRIASKYFLKPGDIVEWKYTKEQSQAAIKVPVK